MNASSWGDIQLIILTIVLKSTVDDKQLTPSPTEWFGHVGGNSRKINHHLVEVPRLVGRQKNGPGIPLGFSEEISRKFC